MPRIGVPHGSPVEEPMLVGGFKHFFIFHNIWNNPSTTNQNVQCKLTRQTCLCKISDIVDDTIWVNYSDHIFSYDNSRLWITSESSGRLMERERVVSWVSNTWFSNQTSKWANNLQSQHKSTIEKMLKMEGVSINPIFLSTAINWWPLAVRHCG